MQWKDEIWNYFASDNLGHTSKKLPLLVAGTITVQKSYLQGQLRYMNSTSSMHMGWLESNLETTTVNLKKVQMSPTLRSLLGHATEMQWLEVCLRGYLSLAWIDAQFF